MIEANISLTEEQDIPRKNLATSWMVQVKNRFLDIRRDYDDIIGRIINEVNTNPKSTAFLDDDPIIFEHT